jgi:hypothetical protein
MDVANVLPFEWGGIPGTEQDVWLPLATSDGTLTAYGTAYLTEARTLTTNGCPPSRTSGSATRVPPANAGLPEITGTPASGSRLSGSRGRWAGHPAPRFAYQWVRCDLNGAHCSAIGGAISTAYDLQDADRGSRLELLVTAANSAGSATALSELTGEIYPRGEAPQPARERTRSKRRLRSMGLRIVRVRRSGRVVVTLRRVGRGRHRARHARRLRPRRSTPTTLTFVIRPARGRWTVIVRGRPSRGYARPRQLRRRIVIGRRRRRH